MGRRARQERYMADGMEVQVAEGRRKRINAGALLSVSAGVHQSLVLSMLGRLSEHSLGTACPSNILRSTATGAFGLYFPGSPPAGSAPRATCTPLRQSATPNTALQASPQNPSAQAAGSTKSSSAASCSASILELSAFWSNFCSASFKGACGPRSRTPRVRGGHDGI